MPSPLFIPVSRALIAKNIQGFTEEQAVVKKAFHAGAKKFLKAVADQLGVPSGTYRLSTNMAGPAICGETVLHTDSVYLMLSEGFMGSTLLYRTCQSQKDYTGGTNHHMKIADLGDATRQASLMKELRTMMAEATPQDEQPRRPSMGH